MQRAKEEEGGHKKKKKINVKQCCDLSGRHKKNICFIFHLLRISQFIFMIIITFHGMFGDLLMFLFRRASIRYRPVRVPYSTYAHTL